MTLRLLLATGTLLLPALALARAETAAASPAPAPAAQLTPPPDAPAPAPGPSSADATAAPDLPEPADLHDKGFAQDVGGIHDTVGPKPPKPPVDVVEPEPEYFKQVDSLRARHDPIQATDYLRKIVVNGDIRPQYRSRAIIELSDLLDTQGEPAEALCWLKMWGQMFPARPEYAAVAYRIATLYNKMGMPDLARDAYYLALGHAVNQGTLKNDADLKNYQRLTNATLWGLAANDYQAGNWKHAQMLFERFRKEAMEPNPLSLEKAAFLEADCAYQQRDTDGAIALYQDALAKHPFNPLALQGRLRLYHLDMMKKQPQQAHEELEALAWTVRTAYPKDEVYWQKQTAQLLLAVNQANAAILPPLLQGSAQLPPEGKTWQEALSHYDALVSYQLVSTHSAVPVHPGGFAKAGDNHSFSEQRDLAAMNSRLDQLLPPAQPSTTPSH
jgi:outer membrane protein assembly factor BamD (BamD/ComL family)